MTTDAASLVCAPLLSLRHPLAVTPRSHYVRKRREFACCRTIEAMEQASSRRGGGIQSAERVLRMLELVGRAPEGLTAAEIAAGLELGQSTAYRLLGTLSDAGYLTRTTTRRYILGRTVDQLGRALQHQLVADDGVRTVLRGMHDELRLPAYLTIFRGDDIAVAHIEDSPDHPRIGQLHVGFSEAAHTTAFGKLMLASRDDTAVARFFERHPPARFTAATVTDVDKLSAQLDEVRAQQLAVEIDEYMPKLACIAAPVRSRTGRTVGAVSVSTATDDFASRAHDLERVVRRGAWHVASSLHA